MAAEEGYDFVVVGAGSAGSVVAHRLASRTAARVLLVEAGGPDLRPEIHDQALSGVLSLWGPGELDWGYATEPQPGLGGRVVPIARGKVWGGSSSINAMLHVRGNRRDFERWAALGNEGWGYRDVLPYFRRSETFRGQASDYRGTEGPVSVLTHAEATPVSRALFAAGAEIGLRDGGAAFDYNAAEQEDTVFFYQSTKNPDLTRSSSATAYLHPALDLPNLTVRDRSLATRLTVAGGRVTGLAYVRDGRYEYARAEREVIVCAGAFESPHLLMLSGIGPAGQLRRHGIGVVADLPAVGANLQDHMILPVAYLSTGFRDAEATLIAETGFFVRTGDQAAEEPPGLQMNLGGLKFVPPDLDQDGPGFTFAPVITQPRSTGSVRLTSGDPAERMAVDPGYLTDRADVESFLEGVETARALAASRAFEPFAKAEIAPGPHARTRAELIAYVRGYAGTLWHPVGTCRMGTGEDAVVDPRLRVRGVDGLRVADASVMPRIVAGNTNAATLMIGEKAADMVIADSGL
ncbi:GMC family oxidoreductase [Actinacidiphila acididurans]|uniref:GMC family oxidoreductase N-terminal domain-containing protein n=1 Tax=Actinacidiphila acididurans TaxID=2784346 RepID=A0ABS2TWK3_9ACTN|nr:GMC family oxidoreductase N-terminal domain-containing protein [Actinacidiphila acididurans]MBM9507462.1 GMC family oxidoreductase N-terminal domain-containing protein [Actinacidiphila acididurans]